MNQPVTRTPGDDAFQLGGAVSERVYQEFCGWLSHNFAGDDYEIEDSDDPYGPLVLVRTRDNARFELELEAAAYPLPPRGVEPEIPGHLAIGAPS